tara:strand:- start:187 stop:804 length:618 start_codon:yes stop_codon:yes gene_type:complete
MLQNIINQILFALSAFMCGNIIFFSVSLSGQRWINNYHHYLTVTLLPIITFVVTTLIAGDLALSLGMVGALSIVRFRNPVKSSFELVIFFLLITLGIATTVDIKWAWFLTILSSLIIYFSKYFKFSEQFSFDDNLTNYSLNLVLKNKLSEIDEHKNLKNFSIEKKDDLKEYNYLFVSKNKNEIKELNNYINKTFSDDIISIEISY